MDLIEIRDLDGPNLFALVPTIKLEISRTTEEHLESSLRAQLREALGDDVPSEPARALMSIIETLHRRTGLIAPDVTVHELDSPGHLAVCFPWDHRSTAMAIARASFDLASGVVPESVDRALDDYREMERDDDERPTWVRDSERRIPIASVTGTNGKTTTTRLLTHIMRTTGYRTGRSSSTGVYIEDEQVLEGDYTGHGGARRVILDPTVDCGILETARGGILLRGLGYESNDVGVFLNVSPDHLGLHGVTRLETLARVKSTVVRVTQPQGIAVLNADDPLVLAQRKHVRAEPVLISRNRDNPDVQQHLREGGRAVVLDGGEILMRSGDQRDVITSISGVPLTYQGSAAHMVENSLAAVAAAIGLGADHVTIRNALSSFHPDPEHNAGRLNVFDLGERIVVIDYAHNESGLEHLFRFATALFPDASLLSAVVGTAGDRGDAVFENLGRMAGAHADRVYLKENPRFLRGRSSGESNRLLQHGLASSPHPERFACSCEREYDALMAALEASEPGEVILVMCIEDYEEILNELDSRGARPRAPVQPAGGQ